MRKDFLTPPSEGSGVTCRTLRTPSDKEWLGVFNSALLTLTEAWRWEQVNLTDLTVEQAVAQCEEILAMFWSSSDCDVCTLPTGEPIIRIAPDGSIEQLTPEGWQPPTGDYAIPPVPPREGGTESDQICLAAANAVNVLKILYEELSDYYNGNLTNAEAITAWLLVVATLIAGAISLALAAILAIASVLFDVLYDSLEFIGADLWTSDVDDAMRCILKDCATNDDGVVTFDFQCVIDAFAAQTNPFGGLTFDELRLFGQVVYMLQMIGGDGLNLAGATTAITEADCTDCPWGIEFDFAVSDGGWYARLDAPPGAACGVYSAGAWRESAYTYLGNGGVGMDIGYMFPPGTVITHLECDMTYVLPGPEASRNYVYRTTNPYAPVLTMTGAGNVWNGTQSGTELAVSVNCRYGGGTGGSVTLTRLKVCGIGTPPPGASSC